MTESRIDIRKVYKVFGTDPGRAMQMLKEGETKDTIHEKLDHVVALQDVSLSVPAGAIYMIMGLSGSGKSTLARCVNRLIEPSSGEILIDGEDVLTMREDRLRETRRSRISMVFQHFALLPNKSVVENVEFGLKLRGMGAKPRRKKAEEVLAVVGLASWAHHRPEALSGGMRQRVGLARALATDADILIMDEAFSALDPLIRSEMQDELLRLQRMLHKTILFITHDFQEALKLGTRIAIMQDGKVVREGSPQEIVLDPRSDYVSAFARDVDRSRLFDAHSVMKPAAGLQSDADLATADPSAPRFVVDKDRRVLGVVPMGVAAGNLTSSMSTDFGLVRGTDKLVEIAGRFGSNLPLAVVDDNGALIGSVDPLQVLGRIGTPQSSSNSPTAG
ncbi:glycine betaine/proline transport system ATP-binding protein [Rhodoligotrophos appendicifer]|uniref:quaternary amine ABC transporter ATP-binding protein n=1 Tax=Rhodoligotrophos appendicifer TaxID=987056 RepID=UPI0011862143|nr:glycine betaine/L-proline ABC transporter ATP-binding protein [Rhodoligotrophos appendicifer]